MPIELLDGGLGTTLEDVFGLNISNTAMWSANCINNNPDVIVQAHLAFLEASASIIQTSTYQCAFETFERAGKSREETMRAMRSSVALAAEARRRFVAATQAASGAARQLPSPIRIALSLGPFGATLSPGQEYGGVYPPPYGPQAYATRGENRVGFTEQEIDAGEERAAVDALAAFHLARLRVFAEDRTTWDELDVLAFETIPLAREIRAVRKAMASLIKEGGVESKPFWISAVFPSGRSPEGGNEDGASGASRVVAAAIDVADGLETPMGIGINCTPPPFVGGLVEELRAELATRKVESWLVLYPNGGGTYDPVSRTWDEGEHEKGAKVGGWVAGLADIARREAASGTWSRVVVGGCCKASPEDIRALAQIMKN